MRPIDNSIITLTTDFGAGSPYVAAMKGVLLGINPQATIVDLDHSIGPQNILQAAFVFSTVYPFFPEGTIHVVVVDPGVGSERRPILLVTPRYFFIAPDNGVLSYVLNEAAPSAAALSLRGLETTRPKQSVSLSGQPRTERIASPPISSVSRDDERECHSRESGNPGGGEMAALRKLPSGLKACDLTNPKYWRHPVSPTFHGRDIFAPVAAHLSLGVAPSKLGKRIDSLFVLPVAHPQREKDKVIGQVIYIDSFGNLITNIRETDIPWKNVEIEIKGRKISRLSSYYAEADGLLALIGSSGHLEIAVANGNAAEVLSSAVGDEVALRNPRMSLREVLPGGRTPKQSPGEGPSPP